MKIRKITAFAVFALSLAAGLAAPAQAAKYKINWQLGHKNLDYFEEAAFEFKKVVENGSKGDIAINIVVQADDAPGRTPEEAPEIAARVSKGETEMGHSFVDVIGGMDPRFYAFKAPYLFRGYRHLEGVFEGPVGAEMLGGLRDHGMVGLAFTYSGGASGVATTGRELRSPQDFKGLKVGVFGDPVDEAWLKSLGATPVAIKHDLETIPALAQDRALDAVVTTWRNFERGSLNTHFSNVSMMHSTYLVSVTYINAKFFDSLPAKYRELIVTASREAGKIERARTIELNEAAKLGMLGKGVRAVNLSEKGRARFVATLKPVYEKSIENVIGKDLVTRIRATSDAPEHSWVPTEFARN